MSDEESMVFWRGLFGDQHSGFPTRVSSFQLMIQPLQRSRYFVSLAILALLGLTGCGKKLPDCSQNDLGKTVNASASSASPPSLSVPRKPVAAKDVLIGIDGSGSMFGYTQAPDPSSWLRLLQSVNLSANTLGLQAKAFRVGGGTATELASGSTTTASNPCFFKGCAPFQPVASSLQTLWQRGYPGQSPPLRLLISDLEVNEGEVSPLIAGIKTDLAKGASAGVLALKLPFTGPVFDSQARPLFKGTLNRPLYLLATGPADQVKALLEEIRKIMAQKGIQSQELSVFGDLNSNLTLTAKDARVIPPEKGAVGLPVQFSTGRFNPGSNSDYRFIQSRPGATGFSVMTIKPWSGGTTRPDLGLVRLERIPLSSNDSTSPGGVKIRHMIVSGNQVRLDLDVPPSTPSGAMRATIETLPEQWWIDWDRENRSDLKPAEKAEKTDGLLLLLNTLSTEIRQAKGTPPAATLCMAFQTTP
jgi:hypothetical protein